MKVVGEGIGVPGAIDWFERDVRLLFLTVGTCPTVAAYRDA
jgi:hypothetical protein